METKLPVIVTALLAAFPLSWSRFSGPGPVSPVLAAENLLSNSSFESISDSVPDGWEPKHSTTLFEATTSAVKEGSRSAILAKIAGKKGWTYASQAVVATPSASYKLSGWVWWSDERVKKASLRIAWLDALGKRIGSSAEEVVAGRRQSVWQLLELIETAPAGTEMARLELFTNLGGVDPAQPTLFDALWFGVWEGAVGEDIFSGTIAEIKDQERGTAVRLRGFVTAPPGVFGDDVFYIRDGSAGIKVNYDRVGDFDLGLGDEAQLGCTIEESHDELYIKMVDDSSLVVVSSGLPGPGPVEVETGGINEDLEGQLVELSGEIVETSGSTFWVDDGSGRAKIYVKDSTGIDIPYKRVGYRAEVVGIVSQWGHLKDGAPNYRVMPRFDKDLVLVEAFVKGVSEGPGEEEVLAAGAVQGAAQLPTTGVPDFQLLLAEVALCLGLALRQVLNLGGLGEFN